MEKFCVIPLLGAEHTVGLLIRAQAKLLEQIEKNKQTTVPQTDGNIFRFHVTVW